MSIHTDRVGKVYLIGAGPGDPGLLTLKGKACLEASDVVLYDRLVSQAVLSMASPDAKLIFVGKEPHNHHATQAQIEEMIVSYALAGHIVARLKGGDPFVFGRGAEEARTLRANDIPFEIVPGITSAIGALAYAGIPVTHRGIATGFQVVTGHECMNSTGVEWKSLTDSRKTLVILMGLANIKQITSKLVEYGRSMHTPACVICNGTTDKQQVVVATLGTIAELAETQHAASPSTIVVGEVVELASELAWFHPHTMVNSLGV